MGKTLFDFPRAVAEIDTEALMENYRLLHGLYGGRTVAVVKADAYGHGTALAVPALLCAGCDFFAVATLSEAVRVRKHAPFADILILGFTPPQRVAELSAGGFIQTVFSRAYAMALSAAAVLSGVCVRVHIKVDGGMCRLGFSPDEGEVIRAVLRLPGLLPLGIFTHFPSADSDPEGTVLSLRRFSALLSALPSGLFVHAAASAAALTLPSAAFDGIRVGIALYGVAPVPTSLPLTPVLRLFSTLVEVRRVPSGTAVGYGGAFRAPRDMRIGVIPVGYADGITRDLEGMEVALCTDAGEVFAPLVGHICMDHAMLALPDEGGNVGDAVCLFRDPRVPARYRGTIPYEILTALSPRVLRRPKGEAYDCFI